MIVPLTNKEGMELLLRILVLLVVIQEDGVWVTLVFSWYPKKNIVDKLE